MTGSESLMAASSPVNRITQLILNWKLDQASVQLEQHQSALSITDIFEIRGLIESYQAYQETFTEAGNVLKEDPVNAQFILNQVPEEIRVTHPDYPSFIETIQSEREKSALEKAEAKVQEAHDAITLDFNSTRAAEALEAAKQIFPNWDRSAELKEKILETTELQEKLARAIFLQTEVSALRESGGLSSYQKAMSLVNEYAALGLDALGIVLFDVEQEREDLLKMITRAEGESWRNRLQSDGMSEEALRLEQSIRSLEDAESRNLRVLYNNNARLIILLTRETQDTDPSSEQVIQANARIAELRRKNLRIETEIHQEVAKRADGYCNLARQALERGEMAAAEINIRMAREAGKSADDASGVGDHLGEVSLPTQTLDNIRHLDETYQAALARRNEISAKYREIRDEYNADDNLTLNKLFSWVNSVDEYHGQDPFVPGLALFRSELRERYDSLKRYALEKGLNEVDRALSRGDFLGAKNGLDPLNTLPLSDEERSEIRTRVQQINKLEDVVNQAEGSLNKAQASYQRLSDSLLIDETAISQLETEYQQLFEVYEKNSLQPPTRLFDQRDDLLRILRGLLDKQAEFDVLKTAMNRELMTIESIKIAETLENTTAFALPPVKKALAKFWFFCAKKDSNRENVPRYLAKAEEFAAEADDPELHAEVAAFRVAFNESFEEGQRINLMLEMLDHFLEEKAFLEGMDYISKNITDDDRKIHN